MARFSCCSIISSLIATLRRVALWILAVSSLATLLSFIDRDRYWNKLSLWLTVAPILRSEAGIIEASTYVVKDFPKTLAYVRNILCIAHI